MSTAKALFAGIGAVMVLLGASSAEAASGFVRGNFKTWNRNGNFCDSTLQACAGSRYPKAGNFDVAVPFMNGRVEVWQGNDRIGFGTSDANGDFTVSWSSDTLTNARVRWMSEHGNGRFVINDTNGLRMNNNSGTFTLTNATTAGSPQPVGSWVGGTSANPDWWMNLYWAAERQFRQTINLVGALQGPYTGVEIRGIDSGAALSGFITADGVCDTSCASGSLKRVQIDSLNSALSPQARMLHEAGHVASYLLKPFVSGSNYCWTQAGATAPPAGQPACTWGRLSAEWAAASFEEAFATFFGDVTFWSATATDPTTCNSSARCAVNAANRIEETHYAGATNNCSTAAANPENRWPMSTLRTLWDAYDVQNDATNETFQEGAGNFWRLFANMTQFPNGVGNNQIDEPWLSTAYTTIDNYDGRSIRDYTAWYANWLDIDDAADVNCDPL